VRTPTRLALALIAALAIGCSTAPSPKIVGDGPDLAKRSPEVTGEVTGVSLTGLSPGGTGLYQQGSSADVRVPTDEEATDAFAAAAIAWVDAHLTGLQRGGPGRVEGAGLTGDANDARFGLTGDTPVADQVTYDVTVGVRGAPEWVQVHVTVTVGDADRVGDFIFLPHRDKGPQLIAFHAGTRTPVPDDAEEADT
jgi:hypothetical protein